ncbi:hypothetical protein GGI02_004636 [Coemansia sp. RSA 2322]|uniref:CAP-Gly domain-containing protein n=1 Tax=Coemansia thaxteri TaxID=2663907 RepID=A0A9W8BI29_9FUNG|nr:hypothetical protein H4R26_003402 [Coemansia thaxteri]KAJ2465634.1 hypothetical protein GGI02_004636 [Coemansia sp. RSA 2322]
MASLTIGGGSAVVTLFVESENSSSERRFQKSQTIEELKTRLEPIVGIRPGDQKIILFDAAATAPVCEIAGDDSKMLGFYPVDNHMVLKVSSTSTSAAGQLDFNDESQVDKYVMGDDEYDQRTGTVRAFKRRHQIGRFADAKSAMSIDEEDEFKSEAEGIEVGSRCEVAMSDGGFNRRGTVRFVGKTQFRPGYWVGVEYDEPVGKHSGSVDGTAYFGCNPGHGSFVRPDKVTTGDFPEEDLFGSDLEEM